MIPTEVEYCIASNFLHRYLPREVMAKVEEKLLPARKWTENKDLNRHKLVNWAIEIIDKQLENKRFG